MDWITGLMLKTHDIHLIRCTKLDHVFEVFICNRGEAGRSCMIVTITVL